MAKHNISSTLGISHQFLSHSLRSSLQSLDNQNAPLENVLHPTVFFGNIHSKQPRKSLYPGNQQHFRVTDTKLISLQQVYLYFVGNLLNVHYLPIGPIDTLPGLLGPLSGPFAQ